MRETTHLNGLSNAIQLNFVERIRTPKWIMGLALNLHLRGLSLINTVSILESFSVGRARSTVHNWVQKADLDPRGGRNPEKIALDETVVKIDGDHHWLFAAVEPDTNVLLRVRVFSLRNLRATKQFLQELDQKHEIEDAELFGGGAPWLQGGLHELSFHFRHETSGERNPVKYVYQKIKRRTNQFYNTFSHAQPSTVENWLQALARAENNPIWSVPCKGKKNHILTIQ